MILAQSLAQARAQRTPRVLPDGRAIWVSRVFPASGATPEMPMVAEHQPPAAWLVDPVQAHHLRQHLEGAATALRVTYDVSLRSEPPDVPLPLTVAERLRHLRQLVGNALHDL